MIFNFFSSSTSEAMMQILYNATMIRRVYLPKTIYILAGVAINGINLILTFIPFLLIALIDKLEFSVQMLMIFPAIALATGFIVGMSLIVATIMVVGFVNAGLMTLSQAVPPNLYILISTSSWKVDS